MTDDWIEHVWEIEGGESQEDDVAAVIWRQIEWKELAADCSG